MRCGIEWGIESCFTFRRRGNEFARTLGWCAVYMALQRNVISGCMYDVYVLQSDVEGKYEKSICIWKLLYVRQMQAFFDCSIPFVVQFSLQFPRSSVDYVPHTMSSFLDEVTVTKNENSCILFIFFPGIYVTYRCSYRKLIKGKTINCGRWKKQIKWKNIIWM